MAAVTTSYEPANAREGWHPALRPMVTGAAAFDAAMGIFCLVDADRVGGWLSISSGAVRSIGVVFLIAAVAGVETLVMPRLGVRWIVGANLLFAAWCLGAIALDGPDAVGAAVLAIAAASSAGTAYAEARLAPCPPRRAGGGGGAPRPASPADDAPGMLSATKVVDPGPRIGDER